MSHSMMIHDEEGRPKITLVGNPDLSGDMVVMWVEGDVEGHEMVHTLEVPGEVLQRIAKFLNKRDLEQRLMKFLEEA